MSDEKETSWDFELDEENKPKQEPEKVKPKVKRVSILTQQEQKNDQPKEQGEAFKLEKQKKRQSIRSVYNKSVEIENKQQEQVEKNARKKQQRKGRTKRGFISLVSYLIFVGLLYYIASQLEIIPDLLK